MTNQQRTTLFAALISIFLLMGQFGALIHDVVHPFHAPTQACHTWSAMEQAGAALVSGNIALAASAVHQTAPLLRRIPLVAHVPSVYSPRAPPFFS